MQNKYHLATFDDNIFDKLPQKALIADGNLTPENISDVCSGDRRQFNELKLYICYHNKLPNFYSEIGIECDDANLWFANMYKSEIVDWYYSQRRQISSNVVEFDDVFYMMDKDLIVNFDFGSAQVRYFYRDTELKVVDAIIAGISQFKIIVGQGKPEIGLLVRSANGLHTQRLEVTKPRLSIAENYNDDFKAIHETILRRLSKKNDKGIVLLHGKPGTGKTSYIRYLITKLKKEVIFLPPNIAAAITGPDLMSVLISSPNSIFIIEDAENIVIDRDTNGGSPVSALLNVADGLLSDSLNIQIICTFNTDISKIDSALLRKGRLIAKYEFKELAVEKAQQLCNKLKVNTKVYKPMTLSEIYNFDDMNFQSQNGKMPIGFQRDLNA